MILPYSKVAAIDDNEDHLQKIVWGLGKAGFCPIPFLFDDGLLDSPPAKPLIGVRVVFTDIHMLGGAYNRTEIHASNIINCLKSIVASGPYAVIFWSQFPGDSAGIISEIQSRALAAGLTPPIGYAEIDKKDVFNVSAGDSVKDDFNADKLRTLILEKISIFKTLAVAMSWEDRVAQAASRATNRIFDLVRSSDNLSNDWDGLLAYLACEAVGQETAKESFTLALDNALLPLLEDQLSLIGAEPAAAKTDLERLLQIVSSDERAVRPSSVAASQLNTSYLIEEFVSTATAKMWARGMVTQLGSAFINSGPFVEAFGTDDASLIRKEFATRDLDFDEKIQTKLHIVELGPECDHVQAKVTTHMFLLAILVPRALFGAFSGAKKGKPSTSSARLRNDSVIDIGCFSLDMGSNEEWHLLVSCRCFMSLATKTAIDGHPKLRLRRATLEELGHRYITYARRPGVMRFSV